MSEAIHNFNVKGGSKDSASKNDACLVDKLHAAVANGGTDVFNWFSSVQSVLQQVNQIIATGGDTVWINGTDTATGYPVWYVVAGDHILEIGGYFTDEGKQQLISGTSTADDYQEIGFAYMVLILNNKQPDQTIHQISTFVIEYAGDGIKSVDIGDGLKNCMTKTVAVVRTFVGKMVKISFEAADEIAADAARETINANAVEAAEASEVQGEIILVENQAVAANIGISAAEAVGLVIGLGVFAVTFTLTFLEKVMVAYVRVYNLSNIPFELSVCFVQEESALISAPMLPQDPMNIPAISPSWTPAATLGTDAIHFVDMIFANTEKSAGIGYVLKAAAYDDFPGFNVMVDIPSRGDNSLYISFDQEDRCDTYYEDKKDLQKTLTMSTVSGDYTLKIATNQLSGQSSSPNDGENGYYYEHLILFENA